MQRFVLPLVALLFGAAEARIINVPDSASTIQGGIGLALNGDTVLVDTGTYYEVIDLQGKLITVASGYIFTGDSSAIENTVIDANGQGTVVTFQSGETPDAVVTGFTIRNGYAVNGGGVRCRGASPTIRSNIIEYNSTGADGAGVYCYELGAPYVLSNIIRHNDSPSWGGGVYVFDGSSPTIVRNVIYDNGFAEELRAPEEPGEVVLAGRRYAEWPAGIELAVNGGGILVTNYQGLQTKPLILNNTIDGNVAAGLGGGIFSNRAAPDIRNNIITSNQGYGVYIQGDTIDISYNDLWGNPSSTGGSVRQGPGSLNLAPEYVDSAANDFRLRPGSPCIDAGDPSSPPDPDSTRADMGAFYHHHVGLAEGCRKPRYHLMPEVTVVREALGLGYGARDEGSRADLLDAAGRKVLDLAPGPNDVRHLSPGVYFVHRASGVMRDASSVERMSKVVVTR